jgi:hypothetical protein
VCRFSLNDGRVLCDTAAISQDSDQTGTCEKNMLRALATAGGAMARALSTAKLTLSPTQLRRTHQLRDVRSVWGLVLAYMAHAVLVTAGRGCFLAGRKKPQQTTWHPLCASSAYRTRPKSRLWYFYVVSIATCVWG